jgi:hypothetical protein
MEAMTAHPPLQAQAHMLVAEGVYNPSEKWMVTFINEDFRIFPASYALKFSTCPGLPKVFCGKGALISKLSGGEFLADALDGGAAF